MSKRTRIIVHSDDFGKSTAINDSILALAEDRRVTSASLMVNAPGTEDAVRRIPKYPNCSFGVHLNLTEFSPVTNHPGLAPLLNSNGEFCVNVRKHRIDANLREAILHEWSAQIALAFKMGVPVSHLDSHLHIHTMPPFLPLLAKLLKAFGLRKIRLTRNLYAPGEQVSLAIRAKKELWNWALRHYAGAHTTEWFGGFRSWHERMEAGRPVTGDVELMTHPGIPGHDPETRLVWGSWKEVFLRGAELISYNDL